MPNEITGPEEPSGAPVGVDALVRRLRLLEVDHDPAGYPPVQMRDISLLCDALIPEATVRGHGPTPHNRDTCLVADCSECSDSLKD